MLLLLLCTRSEPPRLWFWFALLLISLLVGLLQSLAGTLLGEGEQVQAAGWRFEVLALDGRRIDHVLATPLDAPPPDSEMPSDG